MSGWRMGLVVTIWTALGLGGVAAAQSASGPGCTLEKQVYTCDWQGFVQRLDKAQTVAVQTQNLDRFAARQLRKLVGELGKRVAPGGQVGDLTFLLIPMPPTGMHLGPVGEPLATLRIYASAPGNPRATLLWAETYTGQPDRPWPITVDALIQQFKDRFGKQLH